MPIELSDQAQAILDESARAVRQLEAAVAALEESAKNADGVFIGVMRMLGKDPHVHVAVFDQRLQRVVVYERPKADSPTPQPAAAKNGTQ